MFANLINYSYEDMLVLDWMHGLSGLYKWAKKISVGPYGDKSASRSQKRVALELKERRQCKANDVFPQLWPDAPVYLDENSAQILRNLDPDTILHESTVWCKRWWKICRKKVESGTRVTALREQVLTWHNYLTTDVSRKLIIDTGCSLHIHTSLHHTTHTIKSSHPTGCNPLPWRLDDRELARADARVCNIVYPHGTNGCSKEGVSFFKKSGRAWRTSEKILAFMRIMTTATRGFIPIFRAALRKLIWGLRILEGRCVSGNEAVSLNVQPGCTPLLESDIEKSSPLIIEGLSEMEGNFSTKL